MKTVKNGSEVRRVDNEVAEVLVSKKGYSYCAKSEFKGKGKKSEPKVEEVKVVKTEKKRNGSKKGKEAYEASKRDVKE